MHAVIWLEHYLSGNDPPDFSPQGFPQQRLNQYTPVRDRRGAAAQVLWWELRHVHEGAQRSGGGAAESGGAGATANMKSTLRASHLPKLAKQAQSREDPGKDDREGLTKPVRREHKLRFRFTNVGKLPPPVLQFVNVSFGYPGCKPLRWRRLWCRL